MNPRIVKIGMVLLSLWILMGATAFGYSTSTHRLVNDKVYVDSVLDEYFWGELGFALDSKGRILNKYPVKQPWQLFEDAGVAEDSPPYYFRAWNHYHDPILNWGEAGYSNPVLPDGMSSVQWAQDLSTDLSGPNYWTWQRAYDDFLAGLRLPDAAAREQALGDLFTTLGHLTHLVSDISVPEHSRNDAHLLRNYESWCVENLTVLDNMIHGIQVFQPAFEPDDAIFAQNRAVRVSDSAPYSPVSNLWDSRVDPGYNARLGDSPNAPRLYGLADYSNFNYLSNNTVFKDYAHPSREEVGLRLIPRTAPDGPGRADGLRIVFQPEHVGRRPGPAPCGDGPRVSGFAGAAR